MLGGAEKATVILRGGGVASESEEGVLFHLHTNLVERGDGVSEKHGSEMNKTIREIHKRVDIYVVLLQK